MGVPGVNPADKVGKYVKPKDWNKLITDPNTVSVVESDIFLSFHCAEHYIP